MMQPRGIVDRMMAKDEMSQWLGIQILEVTQGFCQLSMDVRPDMLNGFGIAHGGITYSLADSALAFAANSHGRHAVSVQTEIAHFEVVLPDTTIVATTTEIHRGHKIAKYSVDIHGPEDALMAQFSGTVYIKSTIWE